jgi:hypothetical protein
LHTEGAVDSLRKHGYDPLDIGPDEFAAHIRGDMARWTDVVRAAGLKSQIAAVSSTPGAERLPAGASRRA